MKPHLPGFALYGLLKPTCQATVGIGGDWTVTAERDASDNIPRCDARLWVQNNRYATMFICESDTVRAPLTAAKIQKRINELLELAHGRMALQAIENLEGQ